MALKKSFCLLLAVAIIGILPYAADAGTITAQLTLTGVRSDGLNDGYYYVDPYQGSINGGPVVDIWCVDAVHESTIHTSWTVNVTPVSEGDAQETYLNNKTEYLEIVWLITHYYDPEPGFNASQSMVLFQHAIWSYSNSSYSSIDTNVQTLVAQAEAGVLANEVNPTNWRILTPDPKGGNQEFIVDPSVQIPEPGFLLLLALGIGAVCVVTWLAGSSRQ